MRSTQPTRVVVLLAALAALWIPACAGDDQSPTTGEPGRSPPGAPADPLVLHGTDKLVSQWNAQRGKVADCPAYKNAPSAIQMARWGWNIVEVEADGEPADEAEDLTSSASPTGTLRVEKVRFSAHLVRASAPISGLHVFRYTARRTSEKAGVELRADSFDRLDGRLGRAAPAAGKRVFAIVFPDPYHPADLAVAATFDAEDDLLASLPESSPRGSFAAVTEAIHAERAAMAKVAAEASGAAE